MKEETKSPKKLRSIGRKNFYLTEWSNGDIVMLTNGKLYKVESYDLRIKRLNLYSKEYNAHFWADCRIIHKKLNKNMQK